MRGLWSFKRENIPIFTRYVLLVPTSTKKKKNWTKAGAFLHKSKILFTFKT